MSWRRATLLRSRPVKRLCDGEIAELRAQINDLLDRGWIQHSREGHAAAAVFARKPDGSWHICYDYRGLTTITRPQADCDVCVRAHARVSRPHTHTARLSPRHARTLGCLCACARALARACARVRVRVCACVRACECVRVRVCARGRRGRCA